MHRQIAELLPKAKGESKSVFALNLDVRGFSKFSLEVDSVETALYIRKLYQTILNDFFPSVSFFKPTGDGLLMVFDLDEGNTKDLAQSATSIVKKSLELVEQFSSLLEDDEWIYFPLPQLVGVGIARGAACRLVADELTLDYSGTVLNIASRLMDIARPSGVVLDQTFPFSLLPEKIASEFAEDDNVFLRSIAEDFPRRVFYCPDWTEISPSNRRPMKEVEWNEILETQTLDEFQEMGPYFNVKLAAEPIDTSQILVELEYPVKDPPTNTPPKIQWEIPAQKHQWSYKKDAGRPRVILDIESLCEDIAEQDAKPDWPITYRVRYPT